MGNLKHWISRGLLWFSLVALAGCGSPSNVPSANPAAHWIITANALAQISRLDPGVARASFDNDATYVVLDLRGAGVPNGWSSVPVVSYKSYAQLEADVSSGRIPAGVRGVLYDNEAWSFTPADEQRNPGRYTGLAAQLCHQHGLQLIATPAVDLTSVLSPGVADRYQAYLSIGLATKVAQSGADVVEIQAQSLEADTGAYRAFVAAAAHQVQTAGGGHVLVLTGLSTGPTGRVVTAAQLTAAAAATQSVASGYWLNVPGHSPECPTCAQPRPDVALTFLRSLQHA